MTLTIDDVQHAEFPSAPIGRRGYAREQVDDFLDRIVRTLADEDDLTAAEVHHVTFGRPMIGKRGYDEKEVDEFLDKAEETLVEHRGQEIHQVPSAREHHQATDSRAAAAEAEDRAHTRLR